MPATTRRLLIEPMRPEDVSTVVRIENATFVSSWPDNAFRQELEENKLAHYFTARYNGELIGYGGIWVIMEDSHITTIGVHPEHQGKKFGEALLLIMLESAIERGAAWMTLEVRVSNEAAQRLYRKYGFTVVSTRRGYYTDNQESALVMWAGDLRGQLFGARLQALRGRLAEHVLL